MKPSEFLIVFALVSLESEAAPMDFFYGVDAPTYSTNGAESLGSRPHPGGYGYGSRYADVPRNAPRTSNDGRLWVPAPDQKPGKSGYDRYSIDARESYGYPPAEAGLYDQFRRPFDGTTQRRTHQEQGRAVDQGSYSNGFEQRYRFRGDERLNERPRSEGSWHRGYRFRPLTAQERGRQRSETVWRPSSAPIRAGDPYPDVPRDVSVEEAYGYQPDSWFQRYYGERP